MANTVSFLQHLASHVASDNSAPKPSSQPSYSLAHKARQSSGAAKPAPVAASPASTSTTDGSMTPAEKSQADFDG
jgi:hypothetical protein